MSTKKTEVLIPSIHFNSITSTLSNTDEKSSMMRLPLAFSRSTKPFDGFVDKDHIHILFSSKPQVCLSHFINSLKSTSSRLLRKEFPSIKQALWGAAFWSPSYFLASTGEVTLDVLKEYVQSQGHE